MLVVLRHLLAIALLPFMALVVVPWWLLASYAGVDTQWGGLWLLGVALFACGLALLAWCVSCLRASAREPLPPGIRRNGWSPSAPTGTCGTR